MRASTSGWKLRTGLKEKSCGTRRSGMILSCRVSYTTQDHTPSDQYSVHVPYYITPTGIHTSPSEDSVIQHDVFYNKNRTKSCACMYSANEWIRRDELSSTDVPALWWFKGPGRYQIVRGCSRTRAGACRYPATVLRTP